MKKNPQIFYFRESWIGSIISDTVTFGIPAILAWLNYKFLGNSTVFQIAIVIIFWVTTLAKGNTKCKTFYSKAEMIEYLQRAEPHPAQEK